MKKSLIAILFLSNFVVFSEASSGKHKFLNFLGGYAPWNNTKRILPAGLKQEEEILSPTAQTTPSNSVRDNTEEEMDLYLDSKTAVKPEFRYDEAAVVRKSKCTLKTKPQKQKIGKKANILRKALFPTVSSGVRELSEASAEELLKMLHHCKILIDDILRYDFLFTDLQSLTGSDNFFEKYRKAAAFDKEIENELKLPEDFNETKKSLDLKDFLKILIKFYSNIYDKRFLKDCLEAIKNSQVFTLEEIPEAFGMAKDEIYK